MQKLDLKGNFTYKTTPRTFNDAVYTFNLLKNPFSNCAIKFIPQDILRTIPDYENDMFEAVSFNQELRDKVSLHIGEEWSKITKDKKKEALIELIKQDKEVFLQVLKSVKSLKLKHKCRKILVNLLSLKVLRVIYILRKNAKLARQGTTKRILLSTK
jgi:hypothetical protein